METGKQVALTGRLVIREFVTGDARFIQELMHTPGWVQFVGDRGVTDEESAVAYLVNGPIRNYREKGFGFYCMALKEDDTPIGMCGFVKRGGLEHIDFGFAILPQYEGKSYAYEASERLLQLAPELLSTDHLAAITALDNPRSTNLLRRLGFVFRKTIFLPGDPEKLNLYGLDLPQSNDHALPPHA